jgi:hypothetical protein
MSLADTAHRIAPEEKYTIVQEVKVLVGATGGRPGVGRVGKEVTYEFEKMAALPSGLSRKGMIPPA